MRPSNELRSRFFVKRPSGLVPGDAAAAEAFSKMRDGKGYLVNLWAPRNPKHHRLLFAMLNLVVENTDKWPDVETLLADLKLETGLFEARINLLTGMPYAAPASIAFSSMDQARFDEWFAKAVDVLATRALRVAPETLRAEVLAMAGS